MRKFLLVAFAAAAILAMAAPLQRAAAMTVAAPSALGIAAADRGAVQQVRWHGWYPHRYWQPGGYWGAGPYWRHPYWGRYWYPRMYWGWPRLYFWPHPWGCCWYP